MHIAIAFAVGVLVGIALGYAFRGKENKLIAGAGAEAKNLASKL